MRTTRSTFRFLIFAVLGLATAAAFGQGNRGAVAPDRRSLSPEEINQRLARSESFLRSLDQNHNGWVEPQEVSPQQQAIVERILRRAGLEPRLPLSINAVRDRLMASYQGRNGVPQGFGLPATTSGAGIATNSGMVPGFGLYAVNGGKTAPSSGSSAASASKPSDTSMDARIRELASTLIRKYDRDNKGKLSRENWPGGKWGTFDEVNRRGGKYVAVDDLVPYLSELQRRGRLSQELNGPGGSDSIFARSSSRSLTLRERLPKGLPDWFYMKDLDGDGQITMAEFTTEWTPDKLARFERYDLNHDGVITAEECLEVEKTLPAAPVAMPRNRWKRD